jgi:hypothetical protein
MLAKGWRWSIVQAKRKGVARRKALGTHHMQSDYNGLKESRSDKRFRKAGCLTIQILSLRFGGLALEGLYAVSVDLERD